MKKLNEIRFKSQFKEIGHIVQKDEVLYVYSRSPGGKAQAVLCLDSTFNASASGFESSQEQLLIHLEKVLADQGIKVSADEAALEAFMAAPDSKIGLGKLMPNSVRWIQRARLSGIVALTALGTASYFALLQNSGEELADSAWKALSISLTATFVLGIGAKSVIASLPGDQMKSIATGIASGTGFLAGVCALCLNAHLYAPESAEDEETFIRDVLQGSGRNGQGSSNIFETSWEQESQNDKPTPADGDDELNVSDWEQELDTISDPPTQEGGGDVPVSSEEAPTSFWTENIGIKVMISTVLAEALLTASLASFWSRTREKYQDSALRQSPEFKELTKALAESQKGYNAALEKVRPVRGNLNAVAAERANFREIGLARFMTLKG